MSVFIPGMEMPESCEMCRFFQNSGGAWSSGEWFCSAVEEETESEYLTNSRNDWCPLVEIKTPHGRLIDADALEDAFVRYYLNQERKNHLMFAAVEIKQQFADMIADYPSIIEAEGGGDR